MLKRLVVPLAFTGLLATGATSVGLSGTASATTVTANVRTAGAGGGIPGWIKAHRAQIARQVVSISATTIGVTPSALVSDLRSGESIGQVAAGQGVSPQTVETALDNAGEAVVARALAAHKITSAQASAIDTALPGRVAQIVNHVF
jgi:hypothetical protein